MNKTKYENFTNEKLLNYGMSRYVTLMCHLTRYMWHHCTYAV